MIRALVTAWLLAMDAGVTLTPDASRPSTKASLSDEDLEVVRHLELLEDLEASTDLELLQELSLER